VVQPAGQRQMIVGIDVHGGDSGGLGTHTVTS
jgi:hypothetical protein